jgi:hypothetical protein
MMVGTSIGLMGMGLAAAGKMTGSGPDDPKERAVWQAQGIQPYSVKIGDSWYSYKRLGVFGLHLGIAADMFLVAQKASEKEMSDAAGTFVHAIAKNVIDQSCFKGPSDLLRAVTEKGYWRALRSKLPDWLCPLFKRHWPDGATCRSIYKRSEECCRCAEG